MRSVGKPAIKYGYYHVFIAILSKEDNFYVILFCFLGDVALPKSGPEVIKKIDAQLS